MKAVAGGRREPPGHGTYRRYNGRPTDSPRGCRCEPCAEAGRRYRRRKEFLAATGRPLLVDAGPVLAHVRSLADAEMGVNNIARQAGVAPRTVIDLLSGVHCGVRRSTAVKLLAVKVQGPAPDVKVDATGTVRRLRAWSALGYTSAGIGRMCGLSGDAVQDIMGGRRAMVRAVTRDAVREMSARFRAVPGPSVVSRRRAVGRGWFTFAAWDDIDDPLCCPWKGPKPKNSDRRRAIVEDTAELALLGHEAREIAARLGIQWASVVTAHRREGVPVPRLADGAVAV